MTLPNFPARGKMFLRTYLHAFAFPHELKFFLYANSRLKIQNFCSNAAWLVLFYVPSVPHNITVFLHLGHNI